MTQTDKKLAVIILNWNGRKLLEEFLPFVVRYSANPLVEIVVADNGSTDDSLHYVRTAFPDIKIISFPKNYGFAEGYNIAIDEISLPYTILLNSDVEVTEGWWQPLLYFMEKNREVAAVQPKIKSYKNREYFEYAGAAGGLLDCLGYPYCRGRLFDRLEKDKGQYDGAPLDICWASGAALMVRTEVYQKLGGLDTLFFAHMEEIDLCCRMLAAGYRVCVVPSSEVFHVGGASLNQGNPQKTYLNFRNNLLLLYKNLPKRKRNSTLFMRRLADTLAWLMFIAKLDFKNAAAILKAHKDFRKMKKCYDLPEEKKKIDKFPGGDRMIIFDRYILNKKK